MDAALAEQRFRTAATHFSTFFAELERHFVERQELLQQLALALLAREHVLMCGPPGTAKSQVASAVLRRITDEETGEASLFARQFTENTVQTDLVGPIDFKTLTETGRTQHFTDEGMLGAVHAFLDEVLDGRDMLLRSTLNVLHERELKQGGTITKGRIECAAMTTNRYLSEVLEQSRETLLAFVDRIAFVCFVPKGFAKPKSLAQVLHGQVAGQRTTPLRARLTIQDIDVLQQAVERVRIPPALCDALAIFARLFETEVAAAVRADPTFLPTRYLSTRTVVRLGKLLRAICIYDQVFNNPARTLVARQLDLDMLGLALVLSGPKLEDVDALLEHQTDARERRQLSILRTEKEIFRRCLARLGPLLPKPVPEAAPEAVVSEREPEPLDAQTPAKLMERVRRLADIADAPGTADTAAREMLTKVIDELSRRAFTSGVTVRLEHAEPPLESARALAQLADELETASGERRDTARWLRGRALDLLHRGVRLAPTALGELLAEERSADAGTARARQRAENVLARLDATAALRDALLAGGAVPETSDDVAWRQAVDAAAEDVLRVWDTSFRSAVAEALGGRASHELSAVIRALHDPLLAMTETDQRLARLSPGVRGVRDRIVGARLGPVVRAAFERFDARNRLAITEQVEAILGTLQAAGLNRAVSASDILTWTAEALLRTENLVGPSARDPSYEGYRNHRLLEQRVSCAYVLADLCRHLLARAEPVRAPNQWLDAIQKQLLAIPEEARKRCVALDVDRVADAVSLLEAWWAATQRDVMSLSPSEALDHLVRSKFFAVTMDEQALVRFELELELLRRVAGTAPEVDDLERRIQDLVQQSTSTAHDILSRRAEAGWSATLQRSEPPA